MPALELADSDKQKLVDACFEIALQVKRDKRLRKLPNEEFMEKVAAELRQRGFDTIPIGMSWGRLKQ